MGPLRSTWGQGLRDGLLPLVWQQGSGNGLLGEMRLCRKSNQEVLLSFPRLGLGEAAVRAPFYESGVSRESRTTRPCLYRLWQYREGIYQLVNSWATEQLSSLTTVSESSPDAPWWYGRCSVPSKCWLNEWVRVALGRRNFGLDLSQY